MNCIECNSKMNYFEKVESIEQSTNQWECSQCGYTKDIVNSDSEIKKVIDQYIDDVEPLFDAAHNYYIRKQLFIESRIKIVERKKIDRFNKLIERLSKQLGGTPNLIIVHRGEEKPVFDTYVDSLLGELSYSVDKALKTIEQVKTYQVLKYFSRFYEDSESIKHFDDLYEEMFWNYLEMSYIRIASTWDRIGRLFEFVFFNIRQYDRDGFSSTMHKININIAKMDVDLGDSIDWKKLWSYSKSERKDGLMWLLSRRNLIIHQIGLQEISNYDFYDEDDYDSYYNHILERTVKGKLKPLSKKEESEQLSYHINKFFSLFDNIYDVCELYLNKIPRIK